MVNAVWLLAKNLQSGKDNQASFKPSIKVSILGISIGVCIMILSLCVVIGFKDSITNKVVGFGSHLQIVNFESNNTHELSPIYYTDSLLDTLSRISHVTCVEPFIMKEGIIKTDSLFHTMVIKGLDDRNSDECWHFFKNCLEEGTVPIQKNEVLISRTMSKKIQKGVGDDILAYYMDNVVRVRKYNITGIYETGLIEFDRFFVLTPIENLQQLNHWERQQVSGIEITIDDIKNIRFADDIVYSIIANKSDKNGNIYFIRNLVKLNPQIFSWLDLLDMNVIVILTLMCCVALFSVVSGLVIILLEQIRLIGVLKVLGAKNAFIRRIFIILGSRMIGRGLIAGNTIGMGICLFQYFTHLIPLDATIYYIKYVPISFPWFWLIFINLSMGLLSFCVLLLPTVLISKIEPVSIIKFD